MKDEIDGGRKQLQIQSIIDRDEESLRVFQIYQGLREKNGDSHDSKHVKRENYNFTYLK